MKHTDLNYFSVSQTLEIKISPKVYLKYTSYLEYFILLYLEYSSISAGQNTNKSLHNLWSNGLAVRVLVYQTKDPRFKTIRWLKAASAFIIQRSIYEYQEFLGTWWLKVSPDSDSVVYRQMNYIHKVVHRDK